MTVYELKDLYYRHNPDGHYFDRKTMRFFGDTMANFSVRDVGRIKTVDYDTGKIIQVDAVRLYRKRPVNGGLYGASHLFRKDNGQVIYNR